VNTSNTLDSIEIKNSISIAGWIYIRDWYQSWNVFNVINRYKAAGDDGWAFELYSKYSYHISLTPNNTASVANQIPFQPTFLTWYHVAVTYNMAGDDSVRMYINGTKIKTVKAIAPLTNTNHGPLYFGWSHFGPEEYSNGKLDDFIIYNRALTDQEISTIYNPSGTTYFNSSSQVICEDETVQFTNTSTGSSASSWDFGDGGTSTLQNPQHVYTNSGTYTITLSTSNGTIAAGVATKTITVKPLPTLTLTNDTTICAGNNITLAANVPSGNILWDTGVTGPAITVTPGNNTYYTVTATLNGCQRKDSVLVTVLQPTASGILIDRSDSCNGNVHFKCVNTISNNHWLFSNGVTIANNCDLILPFEKGTYDVIYIANPNTDCADTTTRSFSVYVSNTGHVKEVPNTFTPNNDGVNDRFYFSNLPGCDAYEFKIYDRWGLLIFSSDGHHNFWDGRTTSGEIVSDGIFFYIVTQQEKSYNGTITLFR
jgi:gliding motility-associated-like protein